MQVQFVQSQSQSHFDILNLDPNSAEHNPHMMHHFTSLTQN